MSHLVEVGVQFARAICNLRLNRATEFSTHTTEVFGLSMTSRVSQKGQLLNTPADIDGKQHHQRCTEGQDVHSAVPKIGLCPRQISNQE